jgi:hypothetical protein
LAELPEKRLLAIAEIRPENEDSFSDFKEGFGALSVRFSPVISFVTVSVSQDQ